MSITIEQVIAKHLKIRNELSDRRKAFELFEKESKTALERLENWLLAQSKKTGVKSMATNSGTAFRTTKDYVRINGDDGWQALRAYVISTILDPVFDSVSIDDETKAEVFDTAIDQGDFSVFQKRCSKNHIKELMSEGGHTPSELGVTHEEEVVIQVRAPSK